MTQRPHPSPLGIPRPPPHSPAVPSWPEPLRPVPGLGPPPASRLPPSHPHWEAMRTRGALFWLTGRAGGSAGGSSELAPGSVHPHPALQSRVLFVSPSRVEIGWFPYGPSSCPFPQGVPIWRLATRRSASASHRTAPSPAPARLLPRRLWVESLESLEALSGPGSQLH